MFKDKPLATRKLLVKTMVVRMAEAYGVDKAALPEVTGCQKNVINNWSYYGRIPYEHLYHCHEVTGISMDYLLHGEQPPVNLTGTQVNELKSLMQRLLEDGIDFCFINEQKSGAIKQLEDKYGKDLDKWVTALKGQK